MSIPSSPKPAKLVIGLFMRQKRLFHKVAGEMVDHFGPLEIISPWFPFDFTSYYEVEMGAPLFRRMVAFKTLVEQTELPSIKIWTNNLESRFASGNLREVNIDPGYLVRERFVLATGKNFTHRIYIGSGIYADLTLIYTKGAFQALPWTYPDYSDGKMLGFLDLVRRKYLIDIKGEKESR